MREFFDALKRYIRNPSQPSDLLQVMAQSNISHLVPELATVLTHKYPSLDFKALGFTDSTSIPTFVAEIPAGADEDSKSLGFGDSSDSSGGETDPSPTVVAAEKARAGEDSQLLEFGESSCGVQITDPASSKSIPTVLMVDEEDGGDEDAKVVKKRAPLIPRVLLLTNAIAFDALCKRKRREQILDVKRKPMIPRVLLLQEIKRYLNLFGRLFAKKEMRIVMVGLEFAGKTTILYKLKLGQIVTFTPTLGWLVQTVEYKNVSFNVWNVGGQQRQDKISHWRPYFQNTEGLIFVVDSTDMERVVEARDGLHRLLNKDELSNVVLLVFGNKDDRPNAMNSEDIAHKLDLQSLRQRHW